MAARNGRSTTPTSSSSSSTLPFLLLFLLAPTCTAALNITSFLSSYPDLSRFSSLLSSSDVSDDLSSRTSLTLLAVPNSHLHTSAAATSLSDVVRYHVLLRYLTWSDLRSLPTSGQLVPTLFQTTGRAPADLGSLNLTFNPSNGVVSIQPPISPNINPNPNFNSNFSSSATVLTLVRSIPYNLSIFTVSSLISPYGSDLVASELRPPSPGLNITKALIDGHGFNVAASMLSASGVIDEFEADEAGAGITLFVPTDAAFADLPPDIQLQALPADRKALVLKFHVLHSYYPLGSLESIVNPVQPTLATEANGAGSFTLNISKVNGSVALSSGVVQAVVTVTQTVFDQNPVSIFGISHVLLPREIFGGLKGKGVNLGMRNASGDDSMADPPEVGAALVGTPTEPSTPPGLRVEIESEAVMAVNQGSLALVFTVALLYLLSV